MRHVALVKQFLRFAIVGGLGFLVDALVLFELVQEVHLDPYRSRAGSFLVAATFTWVLNRTLTFRVKSKKRVRELGLYLVLMALGGVINVGVYTFVVGGFGSEPIVLLMGLVGGTLSGMLLNFLTARWLLSGRCVY